MADDPKDDCKIIEDHLKSMLCLDCPNNATSSNFAYPSNDITSPGGTHLKNHVETCDASDFQKWEHSGQKKNSVPLHAGSEVPPELLGFVEPTKCAEEYLGSSSLQGDCSSSGRTASSKETAASKSDSSEMFNSFNELKTDGCKEQHVLNNSDVHIKSHSKDSDTNFTDVVQQTGDMKLAALQIGVVTSSSAMSDIKPFPQTQNESSSVAGRTVPLEQNKNVQLKSYERKKVKRKRKKAEKEIAARKQKDFRARKTPEQEKGSSSTDERKVLEEMCYTSVSDILLMHSKEYTMIISKQGTWNFCCGVCDYNTNIESKMVPHMESVPHRNALKKEEEDNFLRRLPEPLAAQITSVNNLLFAQVFCVGLSQANVKDRKSVAERVNEKVKYHLGGSVELVGSSESGFGLHTSGVDLVLKVPPGVNAADMLEQLYQLMQMDPQSHDVQKEFGEKIPRILFRDEKISSLCFITIDNGHATQITKLLKLYGSLDMRVSTLGKIFKYFARISDISNPEKGTLPSYCYVILLIYFLQKQKPPVLPVLQDVTKYMDVDVDAFKNSYGWQSANLQPVGLLWINLLRFYCFEYELGQEVISISSSKKVTCSEKHWGTKFFAIEDPFLHRNLGHVIPNRKVFQYVHECFFNTYRHFGYLRLETGQVNVRRKIASPLSDDNSVLPGSTEESSEATKSLDTDNLSVKDLLEDHDEDLPFDDVVETISKMTIDEANVEGSNCATSSSRNGITENCSSPLSMTTNDDLSDSRAMKDTGSPTAAMNKGNTVMFEWDIDTSKVTSDMLSYSFDSKIFRNDKRAPVICRSCQKLGHLKQDCPDKELPRIIELPPMTEMFQEYLNAVCLKIRNDNQPLKNDLKHREQDRIALEATIRGVYPDAVLELFGSFSNGFGFSKSDMDFCLTFKGNKDGKDLDHVEIIKILAERFRECPRFSNVIPVIGAKVPILKFFDKSSELESDISLYNILAQHNTRMLEAYCKIDSRVQIIGYVLKYFAKQLDICDASRGSLSSYAYTLMAIFFLQQRKPPVVPVLQELYEGKKPEHMVDGWNAWFYDDIKNLHKVWPEGGKNEETVGQLWLGLLTFYASEFKMLDNVITIRQKDVLSRFHKLWNSSRIAIEDPFDLNHNLGSGLSGKMSNYIMKVFIRGREHFGTPVPDETMLQIGPIGLQTYLFDRQKLNNGYEPPKDRGCRSCGKIGHIQKDCPHIRVRQDGKSGQQKKGKDEKQQSQNEKDRSYIKRTPDKESFKKLGIAKPKLRTLPKPKQQHLPQTAERNVAAPDSHGNMPPYGYSQYPPHYMPGLIPQSVLMNGRQQFMFPPQHTIPPRPPISVPFPANARQQQENIAHPHGSRGVPQNNVGMQQHWPRPPGYAGNIAPPRWQHPPPHLAPPPVRNPLMEQQNRTPSFKQPVPAPGAQRPIRFHHPPERFHNSKPFYHTVHNDR